MATLREIREAIADDAETCRMLRGQAELYHADIEWCVTKLEIGIEIGLSVNDPLMASICEEHDRIADCWAEIMGTNGI